jgi:hypothetical protein
MSFTPSAFVLWGKMTLALLAVAALFGPSVAAFANSRPVVPVPAKTWVPVIRARPFSRLAGGSSVDGPPLHIGPTQRTKGLFHEEALRHRMTETASRCAVRSSSYLVLSASVDGRGRLTNVKADAGTDGSLADCATSFLRRNSQVETRGPGTLEIGYFTGREHS